MLAVLAQVSAVVAYFGLVVFFYQQGLLDAGAVAVIIGLLFLFKTVVDSDAISIAHLSPADPKFDIGRPSAELLKTFSFLSIGLGAWVDLSWAMQDGLFPWTVPTAVIHITLVCTMAICVVCCFFRFMVAPTGRR